MPDEGSLEIVGDAIFETMIAELGPQDCDDVAVIQYVNVGPAMEETIIITGEPGSPVWLWVGPVSYTSPGGFEVEEYDYILETNLVPPVAVEPHTWSAVKRLFQ